MAAIRAVLFDLGGTLYDYMTLVPAERESLLELARWAGVEAEEHKILAAHRESLRRVFRAYLPQQFYLHRDMFRDALLGMLEEFGVAVQEDNLERHRARQWERHAQLFELREGVVDTLRALRQRHLHLGIVSNIDDDQLHHLMRVAGLEPYFDSVLSSETARSCKPDPAIFLEALRRAGCQPDEALFVGDTLAQDIAGANRVGMRSVLLWHRDDRDPPDQAPRPRYVIRRIADVLSLVI